MKFKLTVLILMVAQSVLGQDVKTYVYKTVNGKELALDVYAPSIPPKSSRPVVIFFHGGGLVTGNKSSLKNQCSFFAERGIVAVTASYRLLAKNSPDARDSVFKCIEDAKSAVRWVKLHASKLSIDTGTVILGGGSAGGFLATEAALNPSINASDDNLSISTRAKALLLFNPAYTPADRYGPDVQQFINEHTPPSIVFYGENDKFKPGGMKYVEKLNSYNIKNQKWIASNETHGYYNKPEWENITTTLAYNFLIESKIIRGKTIPITNNLYLPNPVSN